MMSGGMGVRGAVAASVNRRRAQNARATEMMPIAQPNSVLPINNASMYPPHQPVLMNEYPVLNERKVNNNGFMQLGGQQSGDGNVECERACVRRCYDHDSVQYAVTGLICLNGLLYIIQYSRWNDDCCIDNDEAQKIFMQIDQGFLIVYTIELSINFYAHYFTPFFRSGWNIFDLIIIGASWIPADTSMAAIRLLRVLRIVRITGKLKSFQLILKTLQESFSGIGSLLLLMLGIMSLYAILGTGLFGQTSPLFADFFASLWTLWITLNGESWPDFAAELAPDYWFYWLYFSSFTIIAGVVVLNMIVAVFIDKMTTTEAQAAFGGKKARERLRLERENSATQDEIALNKLTHAGSEGSLLTAANALSNSGNTRADVLPTIFSWEDTGQLTKPQSRAAIAALMGGNRSTTPEQIIGLVRSGRIQELRAVT